MPQKKMLGNITLIKSEENCFCAASLARARVAKFGDLKKFDRG